MAETAAEAKPEGPLATPAPTAAEIAEGIMIARVEKTIGYFTTEEHTPGQPMIPVDEVGHCIRACGCYVPELILVDQILPAIMEDEFAEQNVIRPSLVRNKQCASFPISTHDMNKVG